MGIFGPILLIVAGIVLHANPGWFAGAFTVGTVCLWFGIGILALWALFVLIAFLIALSQ